MDTEDPKTARHAARRRERWAILGVIVLLLAAVGVPQAFRAAGNGDADGAAPAPHLRAVVLAWDQLPDAAQAETYVDDIARRGADAVCLALPVWQEHAASNSVFIEYRRSPAPARLEALIAHGRGRGLRVAVMPVLRLAQPASGEWPGGIEPTEPYSWWEDYENIVLFYARVAAAAKAEIFCLGSELVSTTEQTQRWRALIDKVAKVYPDGRIAYSANRSNFRTLRWWSDLNLMAATVHGGAGGDGLPTLDDLLDRRRPVAAEVLAHGGRIGKEVLLNLVVPAEAIREPAASASARPPRTTTRTNR